MGVTVQPVGSRRDRKAFLEFPWTLYRGDPHWVPPLRQNQKEMAGFARHPFHDIAEMQTFLARDNGRVVGRVAAIVNRAHNERHNEQRGFFGFFESIDDASVAQSLLGAVREWLAARGIQQIRGPVNPSLNYEIGLLVDGFNGPPTFMMTYNPPFYGPLIESFGFKKVQDLYAFGGTVGMLEGLDKKLFFVAQEAQARFNIEVRPFNKSNFRAEIESFLHLYNASLAGTWGFVPLSHGELVHMSKHMKHLINPELAMFALVDGRPIGAVFGLPDYNPRIKAIDGRLLPFGFLKLLSRKPISRFRVISANVLPEYQSWGVGLVLVKSLVQPVLKAGIQSAEFSWVLESNHLSRRTLERGGANLEKTYRLYDYESGQPAAGGGQ